MELNRLADLMESSDTMQILHNQSPIWIESLNGSTATIKYLNSNQTAEVPVAELVEAELPDLEDQYPTGLFSRISPIIRA
ncbi:MAG: small, acid-soluble spore protein, H family [Syntrophomonadaceae bacterium]|nr:small, acid-soluble spore protein, H family [Syntrophomonadaceae bacterium]